MRNDWFNLAGHMLRSLSAAANQSPAITPQQQNKWVIAATHDEVRTSPALLLQDHPKITYRPTLNICTTHDEVRTSVNLPH